MVAQKDKASLMDAFVDELEERMAIRSGVANRQRSWGAKHTSPSGTPTTNFTRSTSMSSKTV